MTLPDKPHDILDFERVYCSLRVLCLYCRLLHRCTSAFFACDRAGNRKRFSASIIVYNIIVRILYTIRSVARGRAYIIFSTFVSITTTRDHCRHCTAVGRSRLVNRTVVHGVAARRLTPICVLFAIIIFATTWFGDSETTYRTAIKTTAGLVERFSIIFLLSSVRALRIVHLEGRARRQILAGRDRHDNVSYTKSHVVVMDLIPKSSHSTCNARVQLRTYLLLLYCCVDDIPRQNMCAAATSCTQE